MRFSRRNLLSLLPPTSSSLGLRPVAYEIQNRRRALAGRYLEGSKA
jgi:hypothetical protein